MSSGLGRQWKQPHLPGMNVKPTDEHRWPRGFTPERLDKTVDFFQNNVYTTNFAGLEAPLSRGYRTHNYGAQGEKFKRRVTDAVARSTVPLGHLRDLEGIEQHQPAQMGGGHVMGDYQQKTIRINAWAHGAKFGRGDVDISSMEQTLMHELGHHAHQYGKVGPPGEFNKRVRENARGTAEADPVLEGRAEAYGQEHWRQDPREARKRKREFQANYASAGVQRQVGWNMNQVGEFQAIYHGPGAKPTPNRLAHRIAPTVQGRLFERMASSQQVEAERDFGQWPLYRGGGTSDDPIDTIRTLGEKPTAEDLKPRKGKKLPKVVHPFGMSRSD